MRTMLAAALAAGLAALCVALYAAAHRYPRKYFPLMGWSRLAMAAAAASVVFAAFCVVWRQMVYGLGA